MVIATPGLILKREWYLCMIKRLFSVKNLVYIAILVVSAAFVFFGAIIAQRGMVDYDIDAFSVYSARVVEIISRDEDVQDLGWGYFSSVRLVFRAKLTSGDSRGGVVYGEFVNNDALLDIYIREPAVGDNILLVHHDFIDTYFFMDYQRINYIVIFGVIFFVLIVLFGRKKGFSSIIALGLTCFAIFLILVPAILSGANIYFMAILVSAYAIVSTLLIVIGLERKALPAILGCLGGVIFAGVLMIVMDNIVHLTGLVDSDSFALINIPTPEPIDLRAIIFAGVVIGSTGAIMDVTMSISSSLWEVRKASEAIGFSELFKSGIEIGKDILGTMLNTLVLAYIGSSLAMILLLVAQAAQPLEIFNMEIIIVEFLRALLGGFGMLLAVPLTAVVSGWFYAKKVKTSEQADGQVND